MGAHSQGPGHASVREGPPDGAYVLEGSVLETGTPLPAAGVPVRPGGRSVTAWRIGTGRINGVDVSGQVVLVISARPHRARGGPVAGVILLDERARPEQVLALLDAFRGALGGPLGELVRSGDEQRGFSQVPIEYRSGAEGIAVSVPGRLRLVARVGLWDHTHPPACDVSVEVPEHGLAWHDHEVPATYREFRLTRSRVNDVGSL